MWGHWFGVDGMGLSGGSTIAGVGDLWGAGFWIDRVGFAGWGESVWGFEFRVLVLWSLEFWAGLGFGILSFDFGSGVWNFGRYIRWRRSAMPYLRSRRCSRAGGGYRGTSLIRNTHPPRINIGA